MALSIVETPVPLRTDADGTVRVGGTRVTLDTIVGAYLDGATAEDIVDGFPTLELADVYAVLSYYLCAARPQRRRLPARAGAGSRRHPRADRSSLPSR